ncbi:MAG: uvsE [Firmicutes bacterium]|nr:uvsE [Bacillota bacterium]
MQVRFGYVAIALNIAHGSPNKTVTVKNLEKIPDAERINKLRRLTHENLSNTLRILRYNYAHDIALYRLTSKLVPLATHPIASGWNYQDEFAAEWQAIGDYIKRYNLRISAHPDHFTLLNSPKTEVLSAALQDLNYHASMFEAMRLPAEPQLVIHVGGLYKEKEAALARFITQFNELPDRIRLRLMLENDDKIYTAADVLKLCQTVGCPMVLDIHHHTCNNDGENLAELWPAIIKTWNGAIPKIHFSSPKSSTQIRNHADNVSLSDFLPFLLLAKEVQQDFDVMIEAKNKDQALFSLLDELEQVPGIRRIAQAVIKL